MTPKTRWTIAILAVVVALAAALVAQLRDESAPTATFRPPPAREHRDADTPAALAGPRARANLPPCPAPGNGPGPAALRGVLVECAADGSTVDVARALAGRRVVINLWAYWCAPCAAELPAMAEYQRRVGSDVMVVTVHQDENETAALLRLAELGVRLPTLQDGRRLIAAALKVANVVPATVVLRPDGSVAQTLLRDFASADEIAAAVGNDR
ncbi:TlpA family protein disulfide reductase [Mycobacterium sp. Aquia_213]|uniref:TlpA family protein disulfide reductase n=1 Tax=Mycobacterium sp. Aquia_213 TaxID=2991728 RepID=UPI00226D7F50|nr:TlpA disulfide reductase family protein [Mycobacterium sp. Aquia_213]WAC92021.1 TlpA disulfide reductase family protein [Mycobacterium sp. Aquia_213]